MSRIWVATSSGRSQDKDICVSSASDADQSKCYLNSPLRHYKVLHLEPTSTRSYLPRSVLQTKAKLRDAIFFLLQFSNLLCQQNEKELISGGSCGAKRAETARATASSLQCNWKTEGESQAVTTSSTLWWFVTLYWQLDHHYPEGAIWLCGLHLVKKHNSYFRATNSNRKWKKKYANEMQDGHFA